MKQTFTYGFREIGLHNVDFDAASQSFFYGSNDVTDLLTRAQKVYVGGSAFDVEAANREASDAARDAAGLPRIPDGGETSTAKLFLEGVGSDLSKMAKDTRDFLGIGAENAGKGSPLLRWALVAGVLFLLWRGGALDWIKRRLAA